MRRIANYAIVYVGAHLGRDPDDLDVEWADFVGERTAELPFTVPTADSSDPYIGVQAFNVEEFGHEILINGEALTGFDLPPNLGWQYWVDALTGSSLSEGENTVEVVRGTGTDDSFVVGNILVHWKEPLE